MRATAPHAAPQRAAATTSTTRPTASLCDVNTDDELAVWLDVANRADPDHARTFEQIRRTARRFPGFRRWVLYVNDEPAGTATAGRDIHRTDGTFTGRINVLAEHSDSDARHLLFEHAMAWSREEGGLSFETSTYDADRSACEFWAAHGFVERTREIYVEIDPTDIAIPRPPSVAGFHVSTVEERPELLDAMYAIGSKSWNDIPNHANERVIAYDTWVAGMTPESGANHASCFVGLLHDEPVANAELVTPRATPDLIWHGFTGVLREHRGKGIAQALKIHALRWARDNGHRRLRTGNDIDNAPMRHINHQLGYRQHSVELTLRGPV